ncbi:MAG: four helix bundle protein [Bacteroidetes bacterium]|nr:four helix bundle protein [Bacteroidota bacterium]
MSEKEIFIEKLKKRTKKFAVDVIKFCNSLKKYKASSVVLYQLIKSATSTGANYRAACRARSKSEFFSKICIVVEEADESEYWLEIINEANLSNDRKELIRLTNEANEITKIMSKAKISSYNNNK